jgi:ribonuclease HI
MTTPNLEGICVLVDGGCLNNNRPMAERKMYGSLTVFHNGKQIESTIQDRKSLVHHFEEADFGVEDKSNNVAEMQMMLIALNYVMALIQRTDKINLFGKVTVMSDSQIALGLVSGEMRPGKKTSDAWKSGAGVAHDKATVTGVTFQHVDNVWVKSVLGH